VSPLRRSRCGRRVVPEAPSGRRGLSDRRVRVRDQHVPRSSLRGTPSSGAATWRAPCDRAAPRRGRCSTRRGPRALSTGPDGHVDPPDRVERVTGIGPARPARDPRNCRPRPAQCLALARTSCVPRRRSPPSGDAHRGSLEHLVVVVGVDGAPVLDEQGEGQRRRGRAGGAPQRDGGPVITPPTGTDARSWRPVRRPRTTPFDGGGATGRGGAARTCVPGRPPCTRISIPRVGPAFRHFRLR
jgi:hypothetical protein